MRVGVKNAIAIGIAAIMIAFSCGNVNKQAESMRSLEAVNVSNGDTLETALARFLGIKVAACDILWVKQTLDIGGMSQGVVTPASVIYANSRQMSFLNPYFVGNYYFSGTILGMVDVYKEFDMASQIFQTGIEYLPTDPYLKNYFGGVIAYSQGNDAQALSSFETVALKYHDPTLINIIGFLYENKYKQTGNSAYLNQAIYYWKENALSSNSYYSEKAIEKLKQYTNYQG